MAADLLLAVHDDATADALHRPLAQAGWRPQRVGHRWAVRAALADRPWAAVLLQLAWPDDHGLALCRDLRRQSAALPLLVLAAADGPDPSVQRVQGLTHGADDVLVQPVSSLELVARVRALLRRAATPGPAAPWRFGGARLDLQRRTLVRGDGPVGLTRRECDLLVCLLRHRGRTWPRSALLQAVWGDAFGGHSHTVDVHVNRLRAKLEDDPRRPRHIVTVRGAGYRFEDQP